MATTKKTTPAGEYIGLSQAAEALGVSASSVSYYVKQGRLATVEVAGHRAIERSALDAFASTRATTKRAPHGAVRRAILRDMSLGDGSRLRLLAILDGVTG